MIMKRILCLRFDDVSIKENEKNNIVLEDVKRVFAKAGIKIPDNINDRAHQIGKECTDPRINNKFKSIIMRLTTYRHKSIVYRSEKV